MAGNIHGIFNFGFETPATKMLDTTAEPPVTLLVRQVFEFLYRIGVSPSMLSFDLNSRTYCKTGGSKFKKVTLKRSLEALCTDYLTTKFKRRYCASYWSPQRGSVLDLL